MAAKKFKQIYVPIDHVEIKENSKTKGFYGMIANRSHKKAEFHLACGHIKRAPYCVGRLRKTMRCEFCEENEYGYTTI
jgi:hypothetical protein